MFDRWVRVPGWGGAKIVFNSLGYYPPSHRQRIPFPSEPECLEIGRQRSLCLYPTDGFVAEALELVETTDTRPDDIAGADDELITVERYPRLT